MKPLNDNIQIEPIEEEGLLKMVNNEYVVAKVIELPVGCYTDQGDDYMFPKELCPEAKVLCYNVQDFIVGSQKVYLVRYKSILAIL